MVLRILIMISSVTTTNSLRQKSCEKMIVDDKWYEKEVILISYGRPYNLNVHKATNTLFFSLSLPETYTDIDFQVMSINLNSNEEQAIAGIRGGCAITIDQGNDVIYLGGSDGIYKYNMLTKLADFYMEKGKNVWSLYFKDNLFYVSYPDQKLYIGVNGRFMKVKEFENIEIDFFHVTARNDIYFFANKTGLYKFESATLAVEVINELITVRQISEDNNGVMYVCTNFGVYTYSKSNEFKKVIDSRNIFGLSFDVDNRLVYSDDTNIVILKPSNSGCEPTNGGRW